MDNIQSDTVVFIQARYSSVRYPGKVLEKLACGRTVLESLYSRVLQAFDSNQIYFIIPEETELIEYLELKSFPYIIGDLNHVRDRFIKASQKLNPKSILRLTGDNPFIDVDHIHYLEEANQYSFNFLNNHRYDCISFAGLPIGMGGEIFPYESLISEKHGENRLEFEEHVSLHLKFYPNLYKIKKLNPILTRPFLSDENYRLTFDEPEDLRYLLKIQEYFLKINKIDFSAQDLLDHRESLINIPRYNSKVIQVAFDIPKNQEQPKDGISILYGKKEHLGSGHLERTIYLNLVLQIGNHQVEWINHEETPTFPKLIIDARDIDPELYGSNDYLTIDNLNPKIKSEQSLHILPNLNSNFWEKPYVLIPYSIKNKDFQNKNQALVYSGSLSQELVETLYEKIKNLIPSDQNLIWTGNHFPENSPQTWNHIRRMSRYAYKRAIRESKLIVAYFGQTMIEAMYFNKAIFLYSFSEIHHQLGLEFNSKYPCKYLGNLKDQRISNPIIKIDSNENQFDQIEFGDAIEYVYKLYN